MSKIYVDEIVPKTTGGSITSTGLMPTGSVIQTVQSTPYFNGIPNTGDAYVSTASTTYYNMANAGYHWVDITPTSSSSKILVSACFPSYSTGGGYFIFRRSINSGTYEDLTGFDSSLTSEGMALTTNGGWQTNSISWLDTPNTTNTVRYGIFARCTSGTTYMGWANVSSTTQHNFCTYTAQEIAG